MKDAFIPLCAFVLLLFPAVVNAEQWDASKLNALMNESGRVSTLSDGEYARMQERKQAYLKTIKAYLKASLGEADQRVIKAFAAVPREYFMYNYEDNRSLAQSTYESRSRPWAIGYGSYISDYRAQAYMTQMMHPAPSDVSLEIGTGSGFQSAILSRLVKEADTIELITALGEKVDKIYGPLGYDNVHARVGDGFFGWPDPKKKFDIIIVTCATPFVPPPLIAQLKKNGRMVIPIGQPYKAQFLYVFYKDEYGRVHSRRDARTFFIPFISPAIEARDAPAGSSPLSVPSARGHGES
jgi:protein-L-isoaspartate(D-aspartate) O-methyltransferase